MQHTYTEYPCGLRNDAEKPNPRYIFWVLKKRGGKILNGYGVMTRTGRKFQNQGLFWEQIFVVSFLTKAKKTMKNWEKQIYSAVSLSAAHQLGWPPYGCWAYGNIGYVAGDTAGGQSCLRHIENGPEKSIHSTWFINFDSSSSSKKLALACTSFVVIQVIKRGVWLIVINCNCQD